MSTATDTSAALETAYKVRPALPAPVAVPAHPLLLQSTLAQLSHLLAFQHRIQQQGATHYAATVGPPRDLVNRVHTEAARFDQLGADLETRIVRSFASFPLSLRLTL